MASTRSSIEHDDERRGAQRRRQPRRVLSYALAALMAATAFAPAATHAQTVLMTTRTMDAGGSPASGMASETAIGLSTATLTGTIVDASEGALAHVRLTLIHPVLHVQREAVTNGQGAFTFVALMPGQYTLRAEHDSFTPAEVRDLNLAAGERVAIRIALQLDGVREQLAVHAPASSITTGPALDATIDRSGIERTPANGNSVQSLITLMPGVSLVPGATAADLALSVNGQRPGANYVMVDGVSANVATPMGFTPRDAQAMGGALPALTVFGTTASLVSHDALEEIRVQTSGYSAEYGRQPGAQISLATRAGTNALRGTLIESQRIEALGARDWFANRLGRPTPATRQQHAGGAIGGPLVVPGYDGHDRTFFFASHESTRLRHAGVVAATPPMPPSDRVEVFGPPPVIPFTAPAFYAARSSLDATSLRVDHRVTSGLALFGRVHVAPSTQTWRDETNAREQRTRLAPATSTIAGLWTTRGMTHDVRVNYTMHAGRLRERTTAERDGATTVAGTLLQMPGMWPFLLSSQPFRRTRRAADAPTVEFAELSQAQQQINLVGMTTVAIGSHQIKMGGDYRQLIARVDPWEYHMHFSLSGVKGITPPPGAADGVVKSGITLKPRFSNLSLFAQDTMRVAPRLSLDLGVRWEVNPAPRRDAGNFPYTAAAVEPDTRPVIVPEEPHVWKTRYTNIAPRIGAAYTVHDAAAWATVLRAGGGVYYDLGPAQNANAYEGVNAWTKNASLITQWHVVSAPDRGVLELLPRAEASPDTLTTYAVDSDLQSPYTRQWHVSIEQALGASRRVSVSYVAAAARRLIADELWDTTIWLSPTHRRPSSLDVTTNGGASDARSLQVQFQQRAWHGVHAWTSYSWSHATDLSSSTSWSDAPSTLVRADADFDRRHLFSAAIGYGPRAAASGGTIGRLAIVRALLSDWSLDGRIIVQSGAPVSVIARAPNPNSIEPFVWPVRVDGVPLTIDDSAAPGGRRVNPAAFRAPLPGEVTAGSLQQAPGAAIAARNVARGPGAWQVDLALRRRLPLRGRTSITFGVDAYNLFNHPNVGSIDPRLDSPTFGEAQAMLGENTGRISSPYHLGRPRSVEIMLRLAF